VFFVAVKIIAKYLQGSYHSRKVSTRQMTELQYSTYKPSSVSFKVHSTVKLKWFADIFVVVYREAFKL